MVLSTRNIDMEDSMPQTVPSAGYTPPCDYSNFADHFDLSLLPGGDLPLSPTLYTQSPPPSLSCGDKGTQPKIYTTYYPSSPQSDIDLGPDFQKLLVPQQPDKKSTNLYPNSPIYLEVPSSKNYHANSPIGALSPYSPQSLLSPGEPYGVYQTPPGSDHQSPYPGSPDVSFYSPNDYLQSQYIKKETIYPPSPNNNNYQNYEIKQENYLSPCRLVSSPNPDVLDLLDSTPLGKQIKQESTVDFGNILQNFPDLLEEAQKNKNPQTVPEKPKDHQLLREVLRDTSFQRKYNIKPFDFCIMSDIKSEEEGEENAQRALISQEQLARENIEPVLNLAIEQMRKDVDTTCAALGISPDPSQWTSANVLSWLQWTSRQFGLPPPAPEQWDVNGSNLVALSEEEFTRRAPQGGVILHAQLEIWKAAYSEEDLGMQWMPESASSNASSGDISDEDEEETPVQADPSKPSTSRSTGGSHIHLWQFLKELLASPQIHGSCIRWLDRSKGVFKIEDSVKVARLWGKRKNRPAMNYDKLSRSIRQYYKKGIMKKTERSQRLVYQFCHPYNL